MVGWLRGCELRVLFSGLRQAKPLLGFFEPSLSRRGSGVHASKGLGPNLNCDVPTARVARDAVWLMVPCPLSWHLLIREVRAMGKLAGSPCVTTQCKHLKLYQLGA